MLRATAIILLWVLVPTLSGATTLPVPSESYPTIQSGINAAQESDTVLIADGTYSGGGNCDINLSGKDLMVRSEHGPEYTIIDCQGSAYSLHTGFLFTSGESEACRIEGFTIANGFYLSSVFGGGAVHVRYSSPTLVNCVFRDCFSPYGGAVHAFDASPTFIGCQFIDNSGTYGGAVYSDRSASPSFDHCVFKGCQAEYGGVAGINQYGQATFTNCDLLANGASVLGGTSYTGDMGIGAEFANCIVAFSTSGQPVEGGAVQFACCNLYGNEDGDWVGSIADQAEVSGNISASPLFCNWITEDYSVDGTSPCLPENNDCGELIGYTDQICSRSYRVWNIYPDGSGDAPGIGSAVLQALSGDTILLHPGTYTGDENRDIEFGGNGLALLSLDGPASTIIDCGGSLEEPHQAFFFSGGSEPILISGVTFRNGYGLGEESRGGVIEALSTTIDLVDCVFEQNVAGDGGAVFLKGAQATIRNSHFSDNRAVRGGAIATADHNNLTVEDCTFEWNVGFEADSVFASSYDLFARLRSEADRLSEQGLYREVSALLETAATYPTGRWSRDAESMYPSGGLLSSRSGPIYLDPHHFNERGIEETPDTSAPANSKRDSSGGVALSGESDSTVLGLMYYEMPGGGAVSVRHSTARFLSSIFSDNIGSYFGGGIHCFDSAHLTLEGCSFDRCVSGDNGGGGGGVCVTYYSDAHLESCDFRENTAYCGGGLMIESASQAAIRESIFERNQTPYGSGGAVWMKRGAAAEFINCDIVDNTSWRNWKRGGTGGISTQFCTLRMQGCRVLGNLGVSCGGVYACGKTEIDSCLIARNKTEPEVGSTVLTFGGGIRADNGTLAVSRSTISDNAAMSGGNISYSPNLDSLVVRNSVVSFAESGGGMWIQYSTTLGPVVTIENSDFYGNVWDDLTSDKYGLLSANGNFLANPLYCDRHDGDFRLTPESPCLPQNNPSGQLIGFYGYGCEIDPQVWHVEADGTGDFPNIQAAIDAASNYDTIVLGDGTYMGEGNFDISFYGKTLALRSENGPKKTVIDCQATYDILRRGMYFYSGEDSLCLVKGVTITGGYTENGGGVFCDFNSGPSFVDCIIAGNETWDMAGGVAVQVCAPVFENCVISGNSSVDGGGMFLNAPRGAKIRNCTFAFNHAKYGGGLSTYEGRMTEIDKSILAFQADGGSLDCYRGDPPVISCTDIFGNTDGDWIGCIEGLGSINGNISASPLFCDLERGNYRLLPESPCAPANNECGVLIGAGEVGCYPTDVDEPEPEPEELLPTTYSLSQNYPNPFNPSTFIHYALPERSHAQLTVYNILGQEVVTLVDVAQPAGEYSVNWTGRNSRGREVSSGVYLYRLRAKDFVSTRKMLLLK